MSVESLRQSSSLEPLFVEAEAMVPTKHGLFRFVVFRHAGEPGKEHVAVLAGDVRGDDVLVRVHSECMTSEVFGSLKCEVLGDEEAAHAPPHSVAALRRAPARTLLRVLPFPPRRASVR